MVRSSSNRKLTIRGLMLATAVVAVMCALAIPASRVLAGSWVLLAFLICAVGIFGFPLVIGVAGVAVLKNSKSPRRGHYALLVFAVAAVSVPLAYMVARACAATVVP